MQTVVETNSFIRDAEMLLAGDELLALKSFLAFNPMAGTLIRSSGGFRKLRWGKGNHGKSGGVRTIYFFHNQEFPILMVAIYGKNEKENLSDSEINELYDLSKIIKGEANAR